MYGASNNNAMSSEVSHAVLILPGKGESAQRKCSPVFVNHKLTIEANCVPCPMNTERSDFTDIFILKYLMRMLY